MARGNKNSASEDEVGLIHKGINRAYLLATSHMLKKMEEAIESDDPVLMDIAINDRLLSSATKWVALNEVTCALPEEQQDSPLKKQLSEIKKKQAGKVMSFTKEA